MVNPGKQVLNNQYPTTKQELSGIISCLGIRSLVIEY